ncbi:MAG: hypothetical protein ACRD0U_20930 [Acidimicrobiales bacterium]
MSLVRERLRLEGGHADGRAALLGAAGGVLAVLGAFLTWIRVEIDGATAPGSFTTGLQGRDGRTIVAAGVVALIVAGLLAIGRRAPWLPVALLVVGGVATVIAIVTIAEASAKANRIEDTFGIPAGSVVSRPGLGLWLVLLAGGLMLAGGVLARRRAP